MDLFHDVRKMNLDRVAPLAVRMRPRTLEEFAGQHHFLGKGKLLRRMLEAHQGVFMTSPEYSASVTPLLKNMIDWLSRPRSRGEPAYEVFKDRIFAIGAASAGADGGVRSLMALRQILELGCGALVIPEQITVANAADAFDDMDGFKDPHLALSLRGLVHRLVELVRATG